MSGMSGEVECIGGDVWEWPSVRISIVTCPRAMRTHLFGSGVWRGGVQRVGVRFLESHGAGGVIWECMGQDFDCDL